MIESIEFKNFKALCDTTLPLGRFTLIVGPNGSGKSSALRSIEIVKNAPHISFDQLLTAWSSNPTVITVNFRLEEELYQLAGYWDLFEYGKWMGQGSQEELSREVRSMLDEVQIYALNADEIAAPVQLKKKIILQKNGANLAGVLDRLRDESPERFESLNDSLATWLPEFDRILFDTLETGQRAFALRTRQGQHKIPANALSQGVLLALAMITLSYLPFPPTVICFEEPDRGIHPRLLRDVQDALYRLAYPEDYGETRAPVQVIATTHSPYFLDLFRDHPEEVVLANKTEDGTKFERLSDQPNLDEILEDSHLGEVWYTGILGGVPAHA